MVVFGVDVRGSQMGMPYREPWNDSLIALGGYH